MNTGFSSPDPLGDAILNRLNWLVQDAVVNIASTGGDNVGNPWWPPSYDSVIGVSCINFDIWRYSLPNWYPGSPYGNKVELIGLAGGIKSTWKDGTYRLDTDWSLGGEGNRTTTSSATAHVTGLTAVVKEMAPALKHMDTDHSFMNLVWSTGRPLVFYTPAGSDGEGTAIGTDTAYLA